MEGSSYSVSPPWCVSGSVESSRGQQRESNNPCLLAGNKHDKDSPMRIPTRARTRVSNTSTRTGNGRTTPTSVTGTRGFAPPTSSGFVTERLDNARPALQAKLAISHPGDKYEREADRVADAVMRMPDPGASRAIPAIARAGDALAQRMCAGCAEETEHGQVQRQAVESGAREQVEDDEEELVQTKSAAGHAPEVTPSLAAGINSLRGRGQPLSPSERDFFEPRFGHDFSQVRIHTDQKSADLARSINARAFTVGRDIVFGKFQHPQTGYAGRQLLAHELAHTVQQGRTRLYGSGMGLGGVGPARMIQRGVAGGCYVPHMRSSDIGIYIHNYLRRVATAQGVSARELTIPGVGRADLFKRSNRFVELGEIKPNSWLRKKGAAQSQLLRYIRGYRKLHPNRRVVPMHTVRFPPLPFILDGRQILLTTGPRRGVYYYRCTRRRRRRQPQQAPSRVRQRVPRQETEINWSTVRNVLTVLGLSLVLAAAVLYALLSPEPVSKLAAAGLSMALIVLIMRSFGMEAETQESDVEA